MPKKDFEPAAPVLDENVVYVNVDGDLMHPQDFVWLHSHKFPERWHWDSLAAIKCKKCSKISVDFGSKCCLQCASTQFDVLPHRK